MVRISLEEISNDPSAWDDIVQRSPQGTIFHKYQWLDLIQRHTNSKLHCYIASVGDLVIGGFPVFFKDGLIRKIFSPIGPSMVNNLGPLYVNIDEFRQYKKEYYMRESIEKFDALIFSEFKPHIVSITTSAPFFDSRPFIWSGYEVYPKYTYTKSIHDLDDVWNGFKLELKKNIKKMQKDELSIEQGTINDVFFVIDSLARHLNDKNESFTASPDYIEELLKLFYPDYLSPFIAKYNDEPISGILTTRYNGKITLWFGAEKSHIPGIYPVDSLVWHIIQWGNDHGYCSCEYAGANIPSISYFKSRYNFDLSLYFKAVKKARILKLISKTKP